jgi:hypothetical protein
MFGMLGLRLNSDLIAKVVTWTTATALRANESFTRPNAYVRYTTILRCSSGLTDTTRLRCIFQKRCVKTELVQELRLLENTHHLSTPKLPILSLKSRPLIVFSQLVSRFPILAITLHNHIFTFWGGNGLADGCAEFQAPPVCRR